MPSSSPSLHNSKGGPLDREQIERLVVTFYTRIRRNERLGPIFAREITGDWEPHLKKMSDFWCSVMLKTRSYDGRPVPAHQKLAGVTQEDFSIWLQLFEQTAQEIFPPLIAADFVERAELIARSLQIAMFYKLPSSDPS